MMDTVRVGVIGAGYIADYHLGGIVAAGGASLRVISGRSQSRPAELAKRYGIAEVTQNWQSILDRRDVDAVVILTPDATHEEIATAAAQAGKAILLQKPMARSSAECLRIIEAARRAKVDLQISFMHRYFEEVVYARELIAGGKTGQVLSIRLRNATPGPDWKDWFFTKEGGGSGVVLQLGSHGIDLSRHMFGEIERVSATVAIQRPERVLTDGRRVPVELEDLALATYRYVDGMYGTHEMNFVEVQGCDRFRLEIYCTGATLWLRTERGLLSIYAPEVTGRRGWFMPDLPARPMGARHHALWLDGIRGKVPRERTAEDGLATLLIAEAIYKSADEAREVAVSRATDVLRSS
jgi:predicted dehydrogenase